MAAASDVQQAAALAPMVEAVKLRVRPLVASVEPAETAAVRLWFRAMMVSAAALEPALVSAVKVQAAADRWPVASRLLMAAAVRQLPATVARLSARARLASAPGQEPSAKVQARADRRRAACRLSAAAVVRRIPAAAVRLWCRAQPASAPGQEPSATVQAAADRRPVVCRVPAACRRAASNREPECLAGSYSEPVPPLARPTAAAKARARQQRPRRQCLQQQRRQAEAALLEVALLEAAVLQLEPAVGTQGIEPAARLSESARPDWSP